MKQNTRLWHEMTYVFYNFAAESKRIMESGSKKQGRKRWTYLTHWMQLSMLQRTLNSRTNSIKKSRCIKYVYSKLDITKEQCVFLSIFIEKSNDAKVYIRQLC